MRFSSLACLLIFFSLSGCKESSLKELDIHSPTLIEVTPSKQSYGRETDVVVTGTNFIVGVTRTLSGDRNFKVDDHFVLELSAKQQDTGVATVTLSDVRFVDKETLKGVVPADAPSGVYAMTVTTPYGLSYTKKEAYRILSPIDTHPTDSGTDSDAETDSVEDNASTDTVSVVRRRTPLRFKNQSQETDLRHFPVLVVLNADRIDYAETRDDGSDLRFFDADGTTLLPHEIELWDETGSSFVWVDVPQIDGGSSTDMIWMIHDLPDTEARPDSREVWENGYEAVFHLTTLNDASGNLNPAVDLGSTDSIYGIAHSRMFDGVANYLSLGTELPLLVGAFECTLSARVWPTMNRPNDTDYIIGISVNTGGASTILSRAALYLMPGNNVTVAGRSIQSEGLQSVTSKSSAIQHGAWNHVVGVIDYMNDQMRVYINGVEQGSEGVAFERVATFPAAAHTAVIGTQEDHSRDFFDGYIDEVRIADTARSPDWIAAQYLTLSDSFIEYGDPEPMAPAQHQK